MLFSFTILLIQRVSINCYEANIHRNSTYRKALFVKRLEHHKLLGTPLVTKTGLTYDQCTVQCLRHTGCKSFNHESVDPFTCQLMDKMIFDAGTHEVYKENWNNYDPGPVLLPCLARMYNMPDPLTHKLYKNGLTDANEDSLCDMNTDGGEK